MKINFDLKKIIHLMPGNVYWKDRDGIYYGCNENAARLAQLASPDDIVGKTIFDFAPEELARQVEAIDASVMEHGEPVILDNEVGFSEDGSPAVHFTQKIPLKDAAGQVYGMMGVSLDITELKNSQAALKQAKEIAEKASQAKSDFVLHLSHDLRTPLIGILGVAEYLLASEVSDHKKDCLQGIIDASYGLEKFISEILNQVKTAAMVTQQEPVNLKKLLHEVHLLLLPELRRKNLLFLFDYPSVVPTQIFSDSGAIKKIFLNLLANAIKFTDSGTISMQVTVEKHLNHNFILIQVIDTGIGIEEERQSLLFEQFVQINPQSKTRYTGYGLGLWATKKLVDQLDGMITCSSHLGAGSNFKVWLPLFPVNAD